MLRKLHYGRLTTETKHMLKASKCNKVLFQHRWQECFHTRGAQIIANNKCSAALPVMV
jgi:hypothetical protein